MRGMESPVRGQAVPCTVAAPGARGDVSEQGPGRGRAATRAHGGREAWRPAPGRAATAGLRQVALRA